MGSSRTRAAFWWQMVGNTFDNIIRLYLTRAKAADLAETGHDCGHEFAITVTIRGHWISPDDHTDTDADYRSDPSQPVTVRAHNLRDALLLAAAEPLSAWFGEVEDAP